MRYFELLNLRREPFSNSPDPDLFYRTKQHRECLQALEIAIRLKRGLSVVTGHVGTGKTTLCRQLIRVLSDRQGVDTHLVLDPSFSNEREFLIHLSGLFGLGQEEAASLSDWELRETIKAALFRLAVEEDRLVVLIVDEGQKMSLECLEILRELLNYETNEHKLLQMVIFGQLEFEPILEAKANLADRVNLRYRIGPLDFQDTRELIQARLAMCSKDISPEGLFSFWAFLGVYLATDGFPRQIVQLCHQALLAVIIKERPRVTWGVVRSCMRWRTLGLPRRRRWPRLLAAGLTLALLAAGTAWFMGAAVTAPGGIQGPFKALAVEADVLWTSLRGRLSRPDALKEEDKPSSGPGETVRAAVAAEAAPTVPSAQAEQSVSSVEGEATQPAGASQAGSPVPVGPEDAGEPTQDQVQPAPVFLGVLASPAAQSDVVDILTGQPVERFDAAFKPNPARILVDVYGHWDRRADREAQVGSARIDKVRNAVHPDKLRVAIYLKDASAGPFQPQVEKTSRGLRVTVK